MYIKRQYETQTHCNNESIIYTLRMLVFVNGAFAPSAVSSNVAMHRDGQ
jgi:hypothetical protein